MRSTPESDVVHDYKGEDYTGDMKPIPGNYKRIPVYAYRHADQKRITYSVIKARPPASWKLEGWRKVLARLSV